MSQGVIGDIAKKEGISEEIVRAEMEKAIKYAYFQRKTDQELNQKWNELFGADRLPDPEEFITALSRKITDK
ncbi:MAG: hypothetical protein NC092_05220 [Butyrivibrio sp.]|nr:hypothetical protein [Muribaculum sp.]MCM1552075.1 hypothetical protein [Butyrivibrio sp.]